ncbi:MAG: NADH-quinone oxidoreductase subunit A [Geobacter sp.]|nr:NADH-quinone oxidoreductase subunit A [Geobacter sp.]
MTTPAELYPFVIYSVITVIIVAGLLLAARFLGNGTTNQNKRLPYESGIIPSGSARLATNVPFYLVAIFFIVFDVETAFIFTWAIAWQELGLAGLLHITFFIMALMAGLVWIWMKGGLEWGPSAGRSKPGVSLRD